MPHMLPVQVSSLCRGVYYDWEPNIPKKENPQSPISWLHEMVERYRTRIVTGSWGPEGEIPVSTDFFNRPNVNGGAKLIQGAA